MSAGGKRIWSSKSSLFAQEGQGKPGFYESLSRNKSETKEKVYFASVSDRAQLHCYKLADQNRVTMEEHRESCLPQGAQAEENRADLGHDIPFRAHPHWPTSSYQVLPLVPHHLPIILSG